VARIMPPRHRGAFFAGGRTTLERLRLLSVEIGQKWPSGLSAAEAVKEQRRELWLGSASDARGPAWLPWM